MSRRRLSFEKTARHLYVAIRNGYRYEVNYHPRLSSWWAVVYGVDGSTLLGTGDTFEDAQKIAQSHQDIAPAL